jgi:hypothetical protein
MKQECRAGKKTTEDSEYAFHALSLSAVFTGESGNLQ